MHHILTAFNIPLPYMAATDVYFTTNNYLKTTCYLLNKVKRRDTVMNYATCLQFLNRQP